MPQYEASYEARWLGEVYRTLLDYDGQWIAVVGPEVVDSDPDPVSLARRVTGTHGEGVALFASVTSTRVG